MMFNGFILGAKVGIFIETNKFFELFFGFSLAIVKNVVSLQRNWFAISAIKKGRE